MKPIRTRATTRTLGAPSGWDKDRLGPCQGLPVAQGDGFLCSYWRPSWRERLLILLGRPIRLSVAGESTQPPVMLDTEEA